MNIVVAFKVVPDDQDIQIAPDGSLDASKAHRIVSTYDLNALEAAAQLGSSVEGSRVTAVTVGPRTIDDSKLKKNVLARGIDDLLMTADDALANLDAHATAIELRKLVDRTGAWDIVICGDGSADLYAQQVDVQLAACLDVPFVSAAISIDVQGEAAVVRRLLETEIETVEVPLPAVVSVSPGIALPRICGMKDILAAGKKPSTVLGADYVPDASIEIVSEKAPERADRKLQLFDAAEDGAFDQFVAAVKSAL